MKKIFSILIVLLSTLTCWAQNWVAPNAEEFETSTIVNFELMVNGELVAEDAGIKVGAFVDGECRGIVTANNSLAPTADGKGIVYTELMVYGHESDKGKRMTLRAYVNGLEYVLADASGSWFPFDGETLGTLSQLLHFSVMDLKECELVMPDIHLDLDTKPNSDYLEPLLQIVRRDPKTNEITYSMTFEDFLCRPQQFYSSFSNAMPYFTIGSGPFGVGSYVHAMKSTNRKGVTMTATFNIPYWRAMTTTCQVFIAPIDYLDEDVRLRVDDVTLERGETIDLREKVCLLFPTAEWTAEQPVYKEVRYVDVAAHLGYEVSPRWSLDPAVNAYYEWDASDYTLRAKKSTTDVGVAFALTLDFEGEGDGIVMSDEGRVYVKPFDNFDDRATLIFDDIVVAKGQTVDLRDYAYFFFPYTGEFVSFRSLSTRFEYVPDFLAKAGASECCTLDGFGLTGIETMTENVDFCFYTADESHVYWGKASVTVMDEDYYVAIEDFRFELPEVLHRYETVSVPIVITPNDATVDNAHFTFKDPSRSVYGPEGWESADCRIVGSAGDWTLEVTPLVFGRVNLVCQYKHDDHRVELTRSFSVPVEQPLKAGWGWYTFYAHAPEFTVERLDDDLFGGTILDIRSQDALNYKDEEYGFYGDLHDIKRTDCVKVKSLAMADSRHFYPLTLTAPVSFEESTTYTVEPGWNWIGYPYQYSHPLRSLDRFFPKTEGNRLATFTNGFAECDGDYWLSSIDVIPFGEGIMFYNASDAAATFTLPAEKTLPQPDFETMGYGSNRRTSEYEGAFSPSDFPNNMTIVAALADGYDAEGFAIIPFVGGECRGSSRVVKTENGTWLFITAYGAPGERLSFRLRDGYTEYPLAEHLAFSPAAGSLRHPVVFEVPEALNGIVDTPAAPATDDIYDLSGRRLKSAAGSGVYIQGNKIKEKG